ncbi:MAG: penicillin-binding protein 1C [Bacteroidales bacterium]|nr:penicillin-binding protein 1C [Bacteroidales bacterium]
MNGKNKFREIVKKLWKKHPRMITISGAFLAVFLLFLCIPVPHFNDPYATVVLSHDGRLLGARIADDGQWRFPASNNISEKYIQALLTFEDRWFFLHGGINPVSLVDAAIDNYHAGKILRGGSTISMQVVRMARDNQKRTYCEKLIELILALRLELRYSKREILELYAAHAPFGSNVVGIDAAAWRYFNATPEQLTWSEAASLAVLPNSPALVHPGKNREQLKQKRNLLLNKMRETKVFIPKNIRKNVHFSAEDYELAIMENIPEKPFDLPMTAYHFVTDCAQKHKGETIVSSIDESMQKAVVDIVANHYRVNVANGIHNIAVYVKDYQRNQVVAYLGNVLESNNAAMVDMVKAQRSTGSILKPFLYAAMLDEGALCPSMILPDIPINISGYTPQNYSGEYWGAVPADVALQQSLNTPFVYLLRKFGYAKFYNILKKMNLSGLIYPADHYGLSLILGGAEASLYDIVNAYGTMAASLSATKDSSQRQKPIFSKIAIAQTFQAMLSLNRPYNQTGWKFFTSSQKVAWKTGTSFGFKDAWAVGVTDHYVVGVWVGNCDGEGCSGLTGFNVAAPILFDVTAQLNDQYTFRFDTLEAIMVEVCAESGYPKSSNCLHSKTVLMPDVEMMTGVCPYHQKVFLDETQQFQVFPNCYSANPQRYEMYFVLPPTMEWFYKKHTPLYRSLPPIYQGCQNDHSETVMSFIYPENSVRLMIPVGIQGNRQAIIFEIAHRHPEKEIFWNLNDQYIGKTKNIHQMPINVVLGDYLLRCVDEDGNEIIRKFTIAE